MRLLDVTEFIGSLKYDKLYAFLSQHAGAKGSKEKTGSSHSEL